MTSTEAFWNVLREFRDDTLIIQIILTIAASISVRLILFRPGKRTDSFTKIFLSLRLHGTESPVLSSTAARV